MEALAAGIVAAGDKAQLAAEWGGEGSADVLVAWGNRCPVDHPHKLLLEAGYINGSGPHYVDNRLRFISTSWNKLHGQSDGFQGVYKSDRWRQLGIKLRKWRADGDYVLVLDQHPGDATAPDARVWEAIVERVANGRQVVRRPHPLVGVSPPMAEHLDGALCALTWSSTAAIESVIAGVPTITAHDSCIARPVTSDVGAKLFTGDRRKWAHSLAYRQWTHSELRSADSWDSIWQAVCDTE